MSVDVKIKKKLGKFNLDVNFTAEDEIIALLGPSGCGKSMTMKCIAGIEKPDEGRIVLNGNVLFDSEKKINLTPQERKTGFLFQSYALFPSMTVRKNIEAGAQREKDKAKRLENVEKYVEMFKLESLVDHLPSQLSGGQQQRVALARILVSDPQILLLDEPFSALDSDLKFHMEKEVSDVIRAFGKSVILVSHDRGEAYRLSDRIAMMQGGKIEDVLQKEEWLKATNSKIITTDAIPQNVIIVPEEK